MVYYSCNVAFNFNFCLSFVISLGLVEPFLHSVEMDHWKSGSGYFYCFSVALFRTLGKAGSPSRSSTYLAIYDLQSNGIYFGAADPQEDSVLSGGTEFQGDVYI